jgi:hypothetical protein
MKMARKGYTYRTVRVSERSCDEGLSSSTNRYGVQVLTYLFAFHGRFRAPRHVFGVGAHAILQVLPNF